MKVNIRKCGQMISGGGGSTTTRFIDQPFLRKVKRRKVAQNKDYTLCTCPAQ